MGWGRRSAGRVPALDGVRMQFELAVAPAGAANGKKRAAPAANGADGVIALPASAGRSFESFDECLGHPGN